MSSCILLLDLGGILLVYLCGIVPVPQVLVVLVLAAAVLNKRSEEILDSMDHCGFHSVHKDFSLRSELFIFSRNTYCKLAL